MSKIRVVIYLFITTVLVGTIGFKVVGGESWSFLDSLYMTVITLSTVGFQEVHHLEPGGKYGQVPIKLSRIREDFQLLIAGIVHGDDKIDFNPDPETKLNCSQTLMLIGEKKSLRKFKDMIEEEQT
ncbi:MAG: hypothetical protein IID16_07390 [Candidatus Marinimicrobia bacterium]|nr:hypothetical protein [Candidatus Neomarinimicrobiota bacterium]